ncbi:uncharacterized protein [Watersipora subatra]|uniref:uncharacterized protein n=1 Tax=Watersipora subatra TaxID=2589382 RepID=UPI00355AF8B4
MDGQCFKGGITGQCPLTCLGILTRKALETLMENTGWSLVTENDKLHLYTQTNPILNIHLEVPEKAPAYGTWQEFYVGDELDKYKLSGLYLKRLSPSTTAGRLKQIFERAGNVQTAKKLSSQTAYIFFFNADDAQKAIELFHQTIIDGQTIHVEYKRSQKEKPTKTANTEVTSTLNDCSGDFKSMPTERLPVDKEKLHYMNMCKLPKQLEAEFHMNISVDNKSSEVVCKGNQVDVQRLTSRIHQELSKLDHVESAVTEGFAHSFTTVMHNEVLAELKKSKVFASYDLRNGTLHICSGKRWSANLALELIKKFVTERKYPLANQLSDGEIYCVKHSPEWTNFLKNLDENFRSCGLHIHYDELSKRLHIALKASGDISFILKELERFFEQFKNVEEPFLFDDKIKPLVLKNKDYYVELSSRYGVTLDFDHLSSSGYCILKAQSKGSIADFNKILTALQGRIPEKTREYQKPGEVAWFKSSVGKMRLEEISKLFRTIHLGPTSRISTQAPQAMALGSPQNVSVRDSPTTFSALPALVTPSLPEKLKIVKGDISMIEADGLVSSQGAIETCIRRRSQAGKSLQQGFQSVLMDRDGRFRNVSVFHLQTAHWNNTESIIEDLRKNIRRALKALQGCRNIAVPVVGTGALGYPPDKVADAMVGTILDHAMSADTGNQTVTIVIHPDADIVWEAFQVECKRYTGAVSTPTPVMPVKQPSETVRITFQGVVLDNVEKAFERLDFDLDQSILSAEWPTSPEKNAIRKLTQQEMDDIYMKAVNKNLEIVFQLDKTYIWLEGLKDDVNSMKEEINLILYKKSVSTLPFYWDQTAAASDRGHVDLKTGSEEYEEVMRKFEETSCGTKISVIKILRIQNEELYTQYEAQKNKVKKELRDDNSYSIETQLWHGTSVESTKQICAHGFNRSFAGKNGVAYGQGTYFSTQSNYSTGYCSGQGERCIILAKVVTGRYKLGNSSTTTTNLPTQYHSTVDSERNPSIFVVYHDAAAYPEYVIHF